MPSRLKSVPSKRRSKRAHSASCQTKSAPNVQHDRTRAIARNRPGGGLTLTDSATELRAQIELPTNGDGPIVRELIERGVLSGLSAEFRVLPDGESWSGRARLITRAELIGLGLVDQPAHADALIDLEARFKRLGDPTVKRRRVWL